MTALERAARALWDAREARLPEMLRTEWQAQPEAHETHRNFARAVLLAVREPGREACFEGDQLVGDHGSNGEGVFAAMIDAILNEKDTTND